MSFISEITQEQWQGLVNDTKGQRPSKGKQIRVTEGRHLGKVGEVRWHGRNKFSDAWRYASDAQLHLRDLVGRYGFRVLVLDTTGDTFFVDADKVEVLVEVD
jgi:hypothetical protein